MTFFADEGLDFPLVQLLRDKSFKVIYAAEVMKGATDEDILKSAIQENCILITKDKDFGEMVIRNGKYTAGVILIRIDKLNLPQNCILIVNLIEKYLSDLAHNFTVIQEDKIRIRSL